MPQNRLLLLADALSPRLHWAAGWLGRQLTGAPLPIVLPGDSLPQHAGLLAYTNVHPGLPCLHIRPQGLLHRKGVDHPATGPGTWHGLPVIFCGAGGDLPFDLLAAAFYLLQRVEEYQSTTPPDAYGRYHHVHSLAYKNQWLHRPLVDEWVEQLRHQCQQLFPGMVSAPPPFNPKATYDVDMAWSYRHKHWLRQAWGGFRDMAKPNQLWQRLQVWQGRLADPFDIWQELHALHQACHTRPIWFWLLAERQRGYDRNISPRRRQLQALMQQLALQGDTAIHLSWRAAEDAAAIQQECGQFAAIMGELPKANRFHYLRQRLPVTYRLMLQQAPHIVADYSMAYGTINGFRASTARPYHWYDVEKDTATALVIHPAAWMDANCIFEEKLSPTEAKAQAREMAAAVKQMGGPFCTIAHNHFLGHQPPGPAWRQAYAELWQWLSS